MSFDQGLLLNGSSNLDARQRVTGINPCEMNQDLAAWMQLDMNCNLLYCFRPVS